MSHSTIDPIMLSAVTGSNSQASQQWAYPAAAAQYQTPAQIVQSPAQGASNSGSKNKRKRTSSSANRPPAAVLAMATQAASYQDLVRRIQELEGKNGIQERRIRDLEQILQVHGIKHSATVTNNTNANTTTYATATASINPEIFTFGRSGQSVAGTHSQINYPNFAGSQPVFPENYHAAVQQAQQQQQQQQQSSSSSSSSQARVTKGSRSSATSHPHSKSSDASNVHPPPEIVQRITENLAAAESIVKSEMDGQFRCPNTECDHRSKRKDNMLLHIERMHSKLNEVFECCDQPFFTMFDKRYHQKVFHPNNRYDCRFCQHVFYDLNRFTRHMNYHKNVKPISCSYCDHRCGTKWQLNTHLYRKHREMLSAEEFEKFRPKKGAKKAKKEDQNSAAAAAAALAVSQIKVPSMVGVGAAGNHHIQRK